METKSILQKKQIEKVCLICGRKIKVIFYPKGNYRGGHYFGKIPLYRNEELKKALNAGTRKGKINEMRINIFKKSPKPYAFQEYWECPKCY